MINNETRFNSMISISPIQRLVSPDISIVMPAYNHEGFIAEAIDSVRSQTFQNWELIVIDDGSTDETWKVLQNHVMKSADPRIRLFKQTNAGSHATLNRGLSMASSRYLAILNSDDRYAPHRLQTLVQIAEASKSEVFITTGVRLVDENGARLSDEHWWLKMYRDQLTHWHALGANCDNPAVQALMWGNFTVSTSNFFLSRSIWQRIGPFKHLRYVLDWEFALRAASDLPENFIFLPNEQSLDYRLHGKNTILGGALRNHAEALRVLRAFQKKWVANGHKISTQAIDRQHYLSRFIRHEHARQMLEQQKVGWVERVNALDKEVQRRAQEAKHLQEEAATYRQEAASYKQEAASYKQEAASYKQEATIYREQVVQIHASRSWRLTAPLRRVTGLLQTTKKQLRRVGKRLLFGLIAPQRVVARDAYDQWLSAEAAMLERLKVHAEDAVNAMLIKPLISIVMPVHNAPAAFLLAALESVKSQWYEHWELCICDDASTRVDTLDILVQMEQSDARIKVLRRAQTGHIVLATNNAIQMAQGAFVVFLDHDDQLAPHALLRLAQTMNVKPEVDLIYSDEDKLDSEGRRCLPFFKPDWSPVLLWSQNYIGHLMCIRHTLLQDLDGMRIGTQGSQDHDLMLRIANRSSNVVHLHEILYHWQMHPASTSSTPEAKPYAHLAGKDAVAANLASRYGAQFDRVDNSSHTFVYQARFNVPRESLASVIIPTRDHVQLLKNCLDSIFQTTQGMHYEVIVLDNGSIEPASKAYLETMRSESRVRVIDAPMPFNWSRLNNLGRQHANGQLLVFLNNDTEVISPHWLVRLAEYAFLPDVATVGAMLLYPDKTIQHAGVVVGMGGWADHVFKGQVPIHYPSPFVSSVLPRNVLANTGACLAISTERFDQLGGFDESFEICGSDVELGIRAHNQGYQNAYLPDVQLYHLESKTRSSKVPANDFEQSALKYAPYRLGGDPFFNRNLDLSVAAPTALFPHSANVDGN